jgi:hypothetical protein
MHANNLEKSVSICLSAICCNGLKCGPSVPNLRNGQNAPKRSDQFADAEKWFTPTSGKTDPENLNDILQGTAYQDGV